MKNNFYNIIIVYFTISLLLAVTSHYYIVNNIVSTNQSLYYFSLLLLFVLASPILLIYILNLNNKKHKDSLESLEKTNDELYKSNERYDIVAKATSDTIWDWDIKTGGFIWNKGIQGVFGYKKEEIGTDLQWWFEKFIQKTVSKCR